MLLHALRKNEICKKNRRNKIISAPPPPHTDTPEHTSATQRCPFLGCPSFALVPHSAPCFIFRECPMYGTRDMICFNGLAKALGIPCCWNESLGPGHLLDAVVMSEQGLLLCLWGGASCTTGQQGGPRGSNVMGMANMILSSTTVDCWSAQLCYGLQPQSPTDSSTFVCLQNTENSGGNPCLCNFFVKIHF